MSVGKDQDLNEARDILRDFLNKSEIQDLFRLFGLADHTLQNNYEKSHKDEYARELLLAWINKKDGVSQSKYPAGAMWENLKAGLIEYGHVGAADKI